MAPRSRAIVTFTGTMLLLMVSRFVTSRWPQYLRPYYVGTAIAVAVLLTWMVVDYTRKSRTG